MKTDLSLIPLSSYDMVQVRFCHEATTYDDYMIRLSRWVRRILRNSGVRSLNGLDSAIEGYCGGSETHTSIECFIQLGDIGPLVSD